MTLSGVKPYYLSFIKNNLSVLQAQSMCDFKNNPPTPTRFADQKMNKFFYL